VIREAVYGPDHPEVASALINLGVVQLRLGELGDARASLERALAISEAVYGPDHPEVASALGYLGVVQIRTRKLRDARASLKRALAINEAAYGSDHRKVAKTVIDLDVVWRKKTAKYLTYIFLVLMRAIRKTSRGPCP
jgi:Tfp pilus assembly protein PilF